MGVRAIFALPLQVGGIRLGIVGTPRRDHRTAPNRTEQPRPDRTGVLAEGLQTGVEDPFTIVQGAARRQNRRLSDLAQAIVDGSEQMRLSSSSDPLG